MQLEKLIEAALFINPKEIVVKQLALELNEDKSKIIKAIEKLQEKYIEMGSALEIFFDGQKVMMRVKPDILPKVSKFSSESLLDKGTMKTLAIIAFKQPILQSLVIKYRNTKAYDHISKLLEHGLIYREKKGKSYILRTTKKFYEYFGKTLTNPNNS